MWSLISAFLRDVGSILWRDALKISRCHRCSLLSALHHLLCCMFPLSRLLLAQWACEMSQLMTWTTRRWSPIILLCVMAQDGVLTINGDILAPTDIARVMILCLQIYPSQVRTPHTGWPFIHSISRLPREGRLLCFAKLWRQYYPI